MKLLQTMVKESSSDLSKLPKDVMSAIRRNIRKGAEDLQQKWANALELTQKAYEVEGVERPIPTMGAAWEQYEENLQYAVQQLADNRGMDGDWRMSSAVFREAATPTSKFNVTMSYPNGPDNTVVVEAKNLDEVLSNITTQEGDSDLSLVSQTDSVAIFKVSKWNIDNGKRITVTER